MEEAQPQVKVTRISTVTPAVPTERHRMFLSNLDLVWLPISNVQRLLFYKLSPENDYYFIVKSLKESLSAVLVHFYPLAGRLDKGDSGRVDVDCNDGGVHFIEASIDTPFDEAEKDEFQHKPFFENLVPKAHLSQQEIYNIPLLSIQVTAFEGGGMCIGTTLHHVIADGNSFWHFMVSWAECCRGVPVSKPPEHRRTVFKREHKSPVLLSFKAQEVVRDRIAGAKIFNFTADDLQPEEKEETGKGKSREGTLQKWLDHGTDLVYSTFFFSEEMIRQLKQRIGASTSFVAAAAHFWRCVVKAREVPEEESVMFLMSADGRSRVNPALPSTYFGNCICVALGQTTAKKLLSEEGLCFAAGLIEELVNSCTAESQINNMLDWLESLDSPATGCMTIVHEFLGHVTTNVVSSPRFPVYDINYGWGKPMNVQAASMNEIGSMVLFRGRDEGRSIVVSTRLPRHQMEALARLVSATEE